MSEQSDYMEFMLSHPIFTKIQAVLPLHEEIYESFITKIRKLITQGYVKELEKEVVEKKITLQELHQFFDELNNLRKRIPINHLQKFDDETGNDKQKLSKLIQGYTEHMEIVDEIITKSNTKPPNLNELAITDNSNIPSDVLLEFDKYKHEFGKYEALHVPVTPSLLYEVLREISEMSKTKNDSKKEENFETPSDIIQESKHKNLEVKTVV